MASDAPVEVARPREMKRWDRFAQKLAGFLCFWTSASRVSPPPVEGQDYSPNVMDRASLGSRLIFAWANPLLWKGFMQTLLMSDLWDLSLLDCTTTSTGRFEKEWEREIVRARLEAIRVRIYDRLGLGKWQRRWRNFPFVAKIFYSHELYPIAARADIEHAADSLLLNEVEAGEDDLQFEALNNSQSRSTRPRLQLLSDDDDDNFDDDIQSVSDEDEDDEEGDGKSKFRKSPKKKVIYNSGKKYAPAKGVLRHAEEQKIGRFSISSTTSSNQMDTPSIVTPFDSSLTFVPRDEFDEINGTILPLSEYAKYISMPRVFIRAFLRDILKVEATLTIFLLFMFTGPCLLLQNIIKFSQDESMPFWQGILLACGLLINESLRSVTVSNQWTLSIRAAIRARNVIYAVVFKKIMRLRNLGNRSVGEVVNIVTNDSQRMYEAFSFGSFVYAAVLATIITIVFTTYLIGPTALVGCGIFILFYPIQSVVAKAVARQRRACIAITDSRVRIMNELLTCIKLIKTYAWEKPFAGKIRQVRDKERVILEKAGYLQSINLSLTPMVPTLASVITFTLHSLAGNELKASDAFTVIAVFNAMRFPLNMLPQAIKNVTEAKVGLDRLYSFLIQDELQPIENKPEDPNDAIVLKLASFSWDKPGEGRNARLPLGSKPADLSSQVTSNKSWAKKIRKSFSNLSSFKQKSFSASAEIEMQISAVSHSKVEDAGVKSQNSQLGNNEKAETFKIGRLNNVSLTIKRGQLIGICGPVGSGKSSLLSAMLGQMIYETGQVALSGSIAYVGQQAWIFNSSLRENILFGQTMNQERYNFVLDACCLRQDIASLPDGDLTEIGERGINLSGGQKQRISLARAVYNDKEIYLLDDPLSAVDSHVGRHIFNECIANPNLLRKNSKTVVLVTHQLQYLQHCDWLVVMADGTIAEQGTYVQLLESQGVLAKLLKTFYTSSDDGSSSLEEAVSDKNEPIIQNKSLHEKSVSSKASSSSVTANILPNKDKASDIAVSSEGDKPKELMTKEDRVEGAITWQTYREYMQAGGGYMVFVGLWVVFLISMGSKAFADFWLSNWIKQGGEIVNDTVINMNLKDNPDFELNVTVYCVAAIVMVIFQAVRAVYFMRATLKASSNLHNNVFVRVMGAPMSFFDTTPTGRILNRFSKDMDEVDVKLPFFAEQLLQNGTLILLTICVIAVVFPYFLALFLPITIVFLVINTFFNRSARELKRLDNISRSPLYSHLTASLQGITTIRAFGMAESFVTKYIAMVDANTRAFFAFYITNRWLALRLDALTTIITSLTAFFVVLSRGTVPPSSAGLALSYALQLGGMFQFTVRLIAETQSRFTSVERIQHYIRSAPQEDSPEKTEKMDRLENANSSRLHSRSKVVKLDHMDFPHIVPPDSWPLQGAIEFSNYSMRYRPGLSLVIQNMTCTIRPKEKIGIVGRTGAGKSSIAVALFRLVDAVTGSITIDGIDIANVGLEMLRSRLSIIPQDPVLFTGTIRYNLDPFSAYEDSQIWDALERSHMKSKVAELPLKLDTQVIEGGENFSVGERQLLCMARALLRHSRILVLDESTSAIDTETDALIQKTIREEFQDCTLLTIAHRLNTILDSDRILVMSQGSIAEFDTPRALLSNPNSIFSSMVSMSSNL